MNTLQEKKIDKESIITRSASIGEPAWLTSIRGKAFDAFDSMRWPEPDEEEWRRTSLENVSLDADRIVASLANSLQSAPASEIEAGGAHVFRFPYSGGGQAANLVASNPATPSASPSASHTAGLAASLEKARPVLEKAAGQIDNRFAALNMSLWSDGLLVYVPAGVVLKEPVTIDYPGVAGGGINNIHTIVVLGREASATVVQKFSGGDSSALWNVGTTVEVGEGARLSFASSQDLPASAYFFEQYKFFLAKDSVLDSFESYIGGKLTKTRNEVFLGGPGGEARLNGIYLTGDGQHMDLRTVQYHQQRAGTSRAFFKGAVSGGGRSVYQGLIDVDKQATGTDAYLTNNNLILNDGARADSIPSLEIRTDDVKCSHGSTSGKLNEESLFYLMSRGLNREEARKELITGYFEELVITAPELLRENFRSRILDLVG